MNSTKETKKSYKYLQYMALSFAVLAAFVAIIMLINYIQLKQNPPVDNLAMKQLIQNFSEDPNNEVLHQQIRALDLMSRKAFFTAQWQIKSGTTLLVIFVFMALLFFHLHNSKTKKTLLPGALTTNDVPDSQQAQNTIYIAALLFVFIVFGIAWFTQKEMTSGDLVVVAKNEAENQHEGVAVAEQAQNNIESIPETVEESDPEVKTPPSNEKQDVAQKAKDTLAQTIAVVNTQSTEQNKTKENTKQETKAVETAAKTFSEADFRKNTPYLRGYGGYGIFDHKNIPDTWDIESGINLKWKVKVPKSGYNSPVIWGNKIFLTGADASAREVYCFDLQTGKLLWTTAANDIPGSPSVMPKTTDDTGLAAPTLACNGNAVTAMFATGDIIALDLDGNRIWARNLGVPDNHYGHSSSLICDATNVFVQYDDRKNPRVMAINLANGNLAWETHREVSISWASPILVNTGKRMELILTSDPDVIAYDPSTGKELWKQACMSGEVGPSCAYADGLVFAGNEYATLAAIKPNGNTAEILWESDEYLPEAASPLAVNGLLIVCTTYATVAAFSIQDGEKVWEHEFDDGFYSSPVYADGKIFMIDLGGVMHILKADNTGEIISEPSLPEAGFATPAFAQNTIVLRGKQYLYCIENK